MQGAFIHRNGGHMHGKNVLPAQLQLGLPGGIQHRFLQRLGVHDRTGQGEVPQCLGQLCFHFLAQLLVLSDDQNKLPHHLIPLILEQLVAALGSHKALLDAGQLHPRRVHAKC